MGAASCLEMLDAECWNDCKTGWDFEQEMQTITIGTTEEHSPRKMKTTTIADEGLREFTLDTAVDKERERQIDRCLGERPSVCQCVSLWVRVGVGVCVCVGV